jgi:hypothetical protein
LPIAVLRGDSALILDGCSLRAKRGSDLTGPNLTDCSRKGTKYHVVVPGYGVSVACVAMAANVSDTLGFEWLFLAAIPTISRIATVFANWG